MKKLLLGIVLSMLILSRSTQLEVLAEDNKVETKCESNEECVDSTITICDKTNLSKKDFNISSEITLVDKDATDEAKAAYAYLKSIGKSEYVIFGHQNATWHKAGNNELSSSDTQDITGTNPGIIGIDTLSIVGNEYSAERYNSEIVPTTEENLLPETLEGNIQAAVNISNLAIKDGAIITLSSHMPNFSNVVEKEEYKEGQPSYMKYDFSVYTPNDLSGDTMNQLLPGGKNHEKFNAFLDLIASYAEKVEGAILFRPFHENTGSWFWWGAALCDPVTYKSVYKYTVEYLRDVKDIHNILYVYGPGSEALDVEEYEVRYPGDEYVDMVGFDFYNNAPTADNTSWFESFKKELQIVGEFAEIHNKLVAVTETGIANEPQSGDNQTALLRKGNQTKDWYRQVLNIVSESDAAYFLLWADFGKKDGFYIPYVEKINEDGSLHGHELLDDFIDFFNEERSIFASNQKTILESINPKGIKVTSAMKEPTGYITTPVSGTRILKSVFISAKVTGANENSIVQFVLHGEENDIILDAKLDGGLYSAELAKSDLEKLGEKVGMIDLIVDSTVKDTVNAIFNIPEPKEKTYQIDDFEMYYGEESLLNKTWTTNKASGSTIKISLVDKTDKRLSDEYGLRFDYYETVDGWAGATINKEVDWSGCNALQFYTIPDGQNQKTVIQLTANNTIYEIYLNEYADYSQKEKGELLLVTIPFSEFCERDTEGNPKGKLVYDCNAITSFGIWVNAIQNSEAVADGTVEGTIYYDDFKAIKTEENILKIESI